MNHPNHLKVGGGVLIAVAMIGVWCATFVVCIFADISDLTVFSMFGLMLLRTFVQTGLFITAHDAMHGTICPEHRGVNDGVGAISTILYGFLSYPTLVRNHTLHHCCPATQSDPDFHDHSGDRFFSWYCKFMKGYLDRTQIWMVLTGLILAMGVLLIGFNVSGLNVILFWLLPMILSSVQLFYFGTFLPHRKPPQGYPDRHRSLSTDYSVFWSFITCYHFGYHWEHHEYPNAPWYTLPSLRNETPILGGML